MSDPVADLRFNGETLSAYAQKVTADMATGLRRWADNMSATGRRQATSVAASRLRQWVNGTNEDRPTRGELKAWVLLVLDERRGLHNRVEALTKETDAVDDQRDTLVEALAEMKVERDALAAQRDEALEGYREDVERFRAHVQLLDEDRTRRTKERDTAERNLHERTVEMTKRYEELRTAYDQAEGERNELARFVRWPVVGRASCSHTSRGGAE